MASDRYRSSAGLTRCTRCRRHVVAGESPAATHCPFCATRSAPSRLRSTAVAGLLGLAVGCGASEPEVEPVVAQEVQSEPPTHTENAETEPDDEFVAADDDAPVEAYGVPPTTAGDPEPDEQGEQDEQEEEQDEAAEESELDGEAVAAVPERNRVIRTPLYGRAPTRSGPN